jgi:APA family basic amino acid/polyamine antiporter
VAGGVIALCGALSYSELGASMPGSGGEYHFLSRLFHPLFGFLSGWTSFIVGFSAPIAASAIGFSEYFCRALPGIPHWFESAGIMSQAATRTFFAVTVILIFTFIHYRGMKTVYRISSPF